MKILFLFLFLLASCKTIKQPKTSMSNFQHGEYNKTKEYRSWSCMLSRCLNPNNIGYSCYGGIGIKVCDRWKESYKNFLSDMGRAPGPEYSIDRINSKGDYTPENCRWATPLEQANNKCTNRRITLHGQTKTLAEWCRDFDLNYKTAYASIFTRGKNPLEILKNKK